MKILKHITAVLLVYVALLSSCESEKRFEITADDLPETISFSEHIVPIFENNCTKCHDGGTPPNLTAGDAYIELNSGGLLNPDDPESSRLFEAINTGGNMSQYADDLDRAYILEWIKQGANEN